MACGIDAVRDDRVFLDVRLGSHGLEKHFFQGFGRVVADHDAVAVAAFFFGAGGGVVHAAPGSGGQDQRHVGVVQTVKRPAGHEPFQHARGAGPRQPGDQQKLPIGGSAPGFPRSDLAAHQRGVGMGVVQDHLVQQLGQRRMVRLRSP